MQPKVRPCQPCCTKEIFQLYLPLSCTVCHCRCTRRGSTNQDRSGSSHHIQIYMSWLCVSMWIVDCMYPCGLCVSMWIVDCVYLCGLWIVDCGLCVSMWIVDRKYRCSDSTQDKMFCTGSNNFQYIPLMNLVNAVLLLRVNREN